MSLRPGSHGAFGDSLGEAISSAFAGELWALRSIVLPTTGKEDRELLFSAVGQGILQYLARRHADVTVTVPWPVISATTVSVDLAVATLTRTSTQLLGAGFAAGGAVTVRELAAGTVVATASANGQGRFALGLPAVAAGTVLDARDGSGNAAQAVR